MEKTETVIFETSLVKKEEISPTEVYQRNIRTMPPRQMSGHLHRKARNISSMIDDTYAIILANVFNNTKEAGAGGKLESYLR